MRATIPPSPSSARSQLYKPELKMIKRLVGHQLIQQNRSPGTESTVLSVSKKVFVWIQQGAQSSIEGDIYIFFWGGVTSEKSTDWTEPQVDVGRDFFLAADAVRLQRPAALLVWAGGLSGF